MSGNGTATTSDRLLANVERVVLGKHEEISLVLAALAAEGHVLLEDAPGTAKTILSPTTSLSQARSRPTCCPGSPRRSQSS